VKKNPSATKFKVRCSKFLYTLVVADKKKADRIQKSIHPNVKQVLITSKKARRTADKTSK
jgi:large subunit ribosomal protein L38e